MEPLKFTSLLVPKEFAAVILRVSLRSVKGKFIIGLFIYVAIVGWYEFNKGADPNGLLTAGASIMLLVVFAFAIYYVNLARLKKSEAKNPLIEWTLTDQSVNRKGAFNTLSLPWTCLKSMSTDKKWVYLSTTDRRANLFFRKTDIGDFSYEKLASFIESKLKTH